MKKSGDTILSALKMLLKRGSPDTCSPQIRSARLHRGQTIEDLDLAYLLGRAIIPLQATEAHHALAEKVILVTGAAGSIGSELCRQLLQYEPQLLIALDNNETGLFDLVQSLHGRAHALRLWPHICNITDSKSMERLFQEMRPDIVFHAAAYKHVPLLEYFPDQAICTNVLATYHLCCLAQTYETARFVFISTDKAAEPTSVMGASKRLGEILIQSLARSMECSQHPDGGPTCFCAVRFGNVIGSRGSVVPIFARQIAMGGPVTVTDPQATRYFMTIPEACGLVILIAMLADAGGLYLLDMGEPVRIVDLAMKMIQRYGRRGGRNIPIVYTGLRPGEHLHETLVGSGETLVPTMHSKIYTISRGDSVPVFPTVAQWMEVLTESLHCESNARLRTRLFDLVEGAMASIAATGDEDVLVSS